MYAIKRVLKLNKRETSKMRGMAGFKRLIYNFGLDLLFRELGSSGTEDERLKADRCHQKGFHIGDDEKA